MPTTATHSIYHITSERVLFVTFELSEKTWKLGSARILVKGRGRTPSQLPSFRRVEYWRAHL